MAHHGMVGEQGTERWGYMRGGALHLISTGAVVVPRAFCGFWSRPKMVFWTIWWYGLTLCGCSQMKLVTQVDPTAFLKGIPALRAPFGALSRQQAPLGSDLTLGAWDGPQDPTPLPREAP